MINLIVRWFINALVLFIVAKLQIGIGLTNFNSALIGVLVIGLVNALIKPVLFILTLPINLLTLGLFTFVLNALMLMLAASITPGLEVRGLGSAIVGSILISIISTLLYTLIN